MYTTHNSLNLTRSEGTDFKVRITLNPAAIPDAQLGAEMHFLPEKIQLTMFGEFPETTVSISYWDLLSIINKAAYETEFLTDLRSSEF